MCCLKINNMYLSTYKMLFQNAYMLNICKENVIQVLLSYTKRNVIKM